MPKITPCLWFDTQAEEAAKFYISVFKNSKIISTEYYGKEGFEIHGGKEGTVLTVTFELDGQEFMGLNGGPVFTFNESVSFVVDCKDQQEVDYYWEKLIADGGQPSQCGWLKDKYGVSWQIVPTIIDELFKKNDKEKNDRMMKVLLQMVKLDVQALKDAYDGK